MPASLLPYFSIFLIPADNGCHEHTRSRPVQPTAEENPDTTTPRPDQLEIEESGTSDESINYPTGPKLWLTMISLCTAIFLNGLVGFA